MNMKGQIHQIVGQVEVRIYVDASYGGEGCRSQTGILMTLSDQAVSWSSRRQDVAAQSVTEAEYISCAEGAKDASWVRQLLGELGVCVKPTLFTDNDAAQKLCKTAAYHRRTRHVDHRYHYVRQEVELGHMVVKSIKGRDNPADMLTKLLPMAKVGEWTKVLGFSTSE